MYKVEFTSQAEEDLSRLDKVIAEMVLANIKWLLQNIEDVHHK